MTLRVLVVCTANRCRSPMAEVLLRRRLPALDISSAGSLEPGHPASGGSVRAMATRGLDLDDHRSQQLDPAAIDRADLVITMARSHLREVAVADPSALRRTFTLRELVRRGEAVGRAESFAGWLALLGEGRRMADLLGDDPNDDIADPIGGPELGYERTAVQLEDLIERLGRLLDQVSGH
ncbi:MAG: protein tyrosine phosphatase [Acidimicrobiales bacterium]|nr:protein tyrosine phosphatase [Acidimicrobiales bacterium]